MWSISRSANIKGSSGIHKQTFVTKEHACENTDIGQYMENYNYPKHCKT